jgi:hypothetical protein
VTLRPIITADSKDTPLKNNTFGHVHQKGAWKHRTPWLLTLLALLYFAAYVLTYSRYASDDSYIHLRIARNLAQHGVPYYNPDQAVQGSSSLFWLMLLAGLFKLTSHAQALVPFVAFAFTAGSFLITSRLLEARFTRNQSISLAFLVTMTTLVNVAALLMETPAAIFFWLLSIYFWKKGAFTWLGVCSGLAFLTRYEFALWILIGFLMLADRSRMINYIKGVALPGLFYLGFNLYFFGSLIPQTVLAKSKVYTLSFDLFLFILGTPLTSFLIAFLAMIAVALLAIKQKSDPMTKAIVFFPIFLLALYAIRTVFIFNWYVPNVLFPLSLACLLVLRKMHSFLIIAVVVGFLTIFKQSFIDGYGLASGNHHLYRDYDTGRRVHQYLNIGADLTRDYPNAVLMTSEIGGLGWGFRGKIIDAAGLVSPECLKYHPMAVPEDRTAGYLGSIPPQAVRDLQPDLVVSMETFSQAVRRDLQRGNLPNYALLQNYPVVASEEGAVRSTLWGSRSTQVFIHTAATTSR